SRLLNRDDNAVAKDMANRRQTAGEADAHRAPAGWNQPTVRPSTVNRFFATATTCSVVTASTPGRRRPKNPSPATVSKYPSWCAVVVTLSVSKTSLALH